MNTETRVVVVDDHELVRSGLRQILRRKDGFFIVAECDDGDQVLSTVAAHEPDIVIMDLHMRNTGGIEATRQLARTSQAPPVLILTTFHDDELMHGAFRAGADGFILKGTPADDLIRAVHIVARGGSYLDPAVTDKVLSAYRRCRFPRRPDRTAELLTSRERDVFVLVARGLSNQEIAKTLSISEVTVKCHLGRVFNKLDVRDRGGAIIYAYENGVIHPGMESCCG